MTREEAIAFFKDMNECTYGNLEAVEMAIKALEQTRWVPVSEGLPKKDGEYLVTVSSFCGEIVFKCSFAMDLHKVDKYNFAEHKYGFYGIDSEWGSYGINDVIAWMPLPEPYKEG